MKYERFVAAAFLSLFLCAGWSAGGSEVASGGECVGVFQRVFREHLSPGDSLVVIYSAGPRVEGMYSGPSDDGATFLMVGEKGSTGSPSRHGFAGIQSIRYRDMTGVAPGRIVGGMLAGAVFGFVGGVVAMESESSGQELGAIYLPFMNAAVGAVLGFGVGAILDAALPDPARPSKTVYCDRK